MTYLKKTSAPMLSMGAFADDMTATVTDYNPVTVATAGIQSLLSAFGAGTAAAALAAGDDVNVTASGGTSISMSDFKVVAGGCKPMNFPALAYAKNLQMQLNRVASVKGLGKIGVDGEIGNGTLGLLRKVQALTSDVAGDTSSCIYVAGDADVIGDQVMQYANSIGAPLTVTAPASKAASIATKSGLTINQPSANGASVLDAFGGMSGGQKVMFVGMIGGVGYLAFFRKKKKAK